VAQDIAVARDEAAAALLELRSGTSAYLIIGSGRLAFSRWHSSCAMVRTADTPRLFALGRDAGLVAAYQIGGDKPLGQIVSRPVEDRSNGSRFLAGRAFATPGAPSAAALDVHHTPRRQICRTSETPPSARYTAPRFSRSPAIRPLSDQQGHATVRRASDPEYFMNLSYRDRDFADNVVSM
jgi:hypothetical protein